MSSLAEAAPTAVSFDSLIGAMFVGMLVATMLFGVASMQTWFYFRTSHRDRTMFKLMVAIIALLNSTQLASLVYVMYQYLVKNFGDTAATRKSSAAGLFQNFVASLTDLIVRTFFARRVIVICGPKKRILGVGLFTLIFLMSLSVFVFTLTQTFLSYVVGKRPFSPERTAELISLSWLLYAFFSLGAVADLSIAASLSTLLMRHKTGFRRTDDLVSFWVLFSMNTGLVTSIFALLAVIMVATHPDTLYSLGINYVLSQLHVNSLLVSLNARGAFRKHGVYDIDASASLNALTTDRRLSLGTGPAPAANINGIQRRLSLNEHRIADGNGNSDSFAIPLKETRLVVSKEVRTYHDEGKAFVL